MSNYQSHDGLSLGCVERSSHLEEYSRSRPASAGSRPRSLLNKMANAAAAVQLDDDAEPADAEPWVLEGWGDGPSVSEAAQEAALRLGPYVKNVPTTLVGLGPAGGGRRVCSAGHQGRGLLKVSEARRKPGPGPPYSQGDRRSSGPAALAAGNQGVLRRTAVQRNLDVGDESDVEPPTPAPAYTSPPTQGRLTPAQRTGAALRQQNAQQLAQNTLMNAAARLARKEPVASAPGAGASTQPSPPPPLSNMGSAAPEPSSGSSPRHRSLSAESYHADATGAGTAGSAQRIANVPGRTPPHPSTHLEPPSGPTGRAAGGRGSAAPSDPGLQPAERASSSMCPSGTYDLHDSHHHFPGPSHALPGPPIPLSSSTTIAAPAAPGTAASHLAAGSGPPAGLAAAYGGQPGLPLLPGLFPNGRRGASFRNDVNGLSGWDPEAPAIPHQPAVGQASQASPNLPLWIGPAGAGGAGVVGTGLQPQAPSTTAGGPVAPSGRGSPIHGTQVPHRRDSSSRMQRVGGGAALGILDLSLTPERSSSDKTGQGTVSNSQNRGGRAPGGGVLYSGVTPAARSLSPDVAGRGGCPHFFSAPQQDALSEFCASRPELGSAGTASGSISGASPGDARIHPGTPSTPIMPGMPVTVPMRVTSLAKATAVGRVS
ncbi:hypothetical protein VOLCADRAFT_103129 [Volvox carteri f. nagariensis]|uniref:Uncharacterized protein n=1 Tax=Volvox carteri f. nagariensis TaxID=3068 RepID=D8TKT0_VOLCA|nr:uncharacterized protein VOLCADRAFT_103129 [Volvox carteri f. nagariensis]EFJ51938.1 hypothetical protein VOLCADRAFT_103129 [Volvox carteri f. nagariensis]|eukprot:XP_002946712.1 hypothetical protein VOLCADRAFT_103129 [Volvox carteri f. nagariensis]